MENFQATTWRWNFYCVLPLNIIAFSVQTHKPPLKKTQNTETGNIHSFKAIKVGYMIIVR